AAVPPPLAAVTVQSAQSFAAGHTAPAVSARVAALTEGVIKSMFLTKMKVCTLVVLAIVAAVSAVGGWTRSFPVGQTEAAPAPARPRPRITAANAAKVQELAAIDKGVWEIVWKPDGKEVAFVPWEGPVEVRSTSDFKPLRTLAKDKRVLHFAF